jgi:hypothetical protein
MSLLLLAGDVLVGLELGAAVTHTCAHAHTHTHTHILTRAHAHTITHMIHDCRIGYSQECRAEGMTKNYSEEAVNLLCRQSCRTDRCTNTRCTPSRHAKVVGPKLTLEHKSAHQHTLHTNKTCTTLTQRATRGRHHPSTQSR